MNVPFAWLFDSSPWWQDLVKLAAGLLIAALAYAGRLRYANGDEIEELPRRRDLERPADESELL